MIQLIVVTASVILGMILYPVIIKHYTRFINTQYRKLNGEHLPVEKTPQKEAKKEKKQVEKPALIGKSKFTLSQSTPKNATEIETEKGEEKESIFAPETGENPERMDIDVPLEKVGTLPEDINEEEEEISLYTGKDATYAGGASYEELMQVKEVIEKPSSSEREEREAGKILFEHQDTEIVERLLSGSQIMSLKVSALIKLHLDEHEKEKRAMTGETEKETGDKEYEDFDINQIL